MMHGNYLIVGFCRLRQKYISDETIGAELCKDKAVIEVDKKATEKNKKPVTPDENEDEFIRRAAFGG